MAETQRNWAGNITYGTNNLYVPETIAQLQELVLQQDKVKVLGSRHSFNHIADSDANLISLEKLDQVVALDRENHTVTVEGGVRYGQLSRYLHKEGYALHNLASLPHISVAGACATATHGSGNRNGNLATAVTAVEIMTADGEFITLSREHDVQFPGAVVGLGALGVVTRLTLDILPTFDMRQNLYENLPLLQLIDHFDEITSAAYSVSLFTDWRSELVNQVWLKSLAAQDEASPPDPEFFGATVAADNLHPLAGHSAENCTEQLGVPGAWFERLPHFRIDFTPSSGAELQSEYFVPRQQALAALQALNDIRQQIASPLMISEIRTIAADDLWLSPCYQQPMVAFHFTWHPDWTAVKKVLPLIEAQLEPFNGRPHWGKLFTMEPARLQSLYTKLPDFRQLCEQFDPTGKFRNSFLHSTIWG